MAVQQAVRYRISGLRLKRKREVLSSFGLNNMEAEHEVEAWEAGDLEEEAPPSEKP